MTDAQQREAARQFYYKWNGKGKEDEDARSYWIDVLVNIFGMENMTDRVQFEKKVAGDKSTKRIDVYIPETHVLIEQKSLGIALDKPQPGHDNKTPYEQAKEYDNLLPYDEKARWIITSNFAEIWIYDMAVMKPEPTKITLTDFPAKYHMLDFMINREVKKLTEELKLSIKAGELVGKIHDRFLEQYHDPMAKKTQNSLNILCVRLVFCLYAEDAGLFGDHDAFKSYIAQYEPKDIRRALIDLFEVLNTPEDERAEMYLSEDLEKFPYVNGGLFERENIVIPKITDEIKEVLLEASLFDWSHISPVIFGAVFESTLNPETRRAGGMHYTSIENIHKVIDPLFLDDLKAEFEEIKKIDVVRTRDRKLHAFQDKLASLVFLDPAAGSGNFLTETFLSLRRLENEALRILTGGQITLGDVLNPIKVSISQFFGIEINDFAVTVARTALWIAESQMMKETEDIVHMQLDFLPLKTNAYIVERNALQTDWDDVVNKGKLTYIMGNPPFVGTKMMSKFQKEDTKLVLGKWKNYGTLDYVACWYKKAAEYIIGTKIRCAFVSTNSITQGEQVAPLWEPMIEELHTHIDFAHRTFQWDSEASIKAHVHCVIIGFSQVGRATRKLLFENNKVAEVDNINPYLVDAPNIYIESRKTPISDNAPTMYIGCEMKDDGLYTLSEEEKDQLIVEYPGIEQFIHPYYMGRDMINRKPRYCFWLKNADPTELKKYPFILDRIKKVRQFRLDCPSPDTNRYAEFPMLPVRLRYYSEDRNTEALAIPKVSSQNRRYIPMDVISADSIAGSKLFLVPSVGLFAFGVMTSNVHMSWVRTVCGRLKSDYSYASNVVYNTFPWPDPTDVQKGKIEITAQGILDARLQYPDASLADLYDPLTMPDSLRKAHQRNDAAVMQAYGMPIKETDEAACVAWLMRLYQEKVGEQK